MKLFEVLYTGVWMLLRDYNTFSHRSNQIKLYLYTLLYVQCLCSLGVILTRYTAELGIWDFTVLLVMVNMDDIHS